MQFTKTIISVICFFAFTNLQAQDNKTQLASLNIIDTTIKAVQDTTAKKVAADTTIKTKDTGNILKHDPNKATRRSALIPGWGQAYNREYWKIPIVAGALAVPAVLFVYNNKWYKETRDAYSIVINGETDRYNEIDPKLINPETGLPIDAPSLQYYRNEFRRSRDYSVLFFIVAWGLNVVDATVFGHLKDFDVSDDLSIHLKPNFNPETKTLGLAFTFKKPQQKTLPAF